MLMFRFWASESRGSEKTEQVVQPMIDFCKPVQPPFISDISLTSPPRPPKRRRQSNIAIASQPAAIHPAVKRPRTDDDESAPKAKVTVSRVEDGRVLSQPVAKMTADLERAKEVIQHHFSLEILHKHNELRLINQELAKCQVALEQLRRCHLIPYPVNVPTPEQMLNVSSGKGPALQAKVGDKVPEWAPPFGVTDGPYARHYAKWLIPDAKFDGIIPEVPAQAEYARARSSMESRSMRHSISDIGSIHGKGRSSRAPVKLQALPSGYAQPKDKSGPCILKRAADGKMVKLVCPGTKEKPCNRENFSSTQGFINHCRIAHKLEYKSHEEAAIACGHPVDVPEAGTVVEEKMAAVVQSNTGLPPSGLVHPFARENALTESEACRSVLARIEESMEMFRRGQLPGVTFIPGECKGSATPQIQAPTQSTNLTPSSESPHLSRLLQNRGVSMNLSELVRDAKTPVNLDDISPDEEDESSSETETASLVPGMRIPARTTMSPVPLPTIPRPGSSKGRTPQMSYATPIPTPAPRAAAPEHELGMVIEDDMDMDMSPNTAISNNAPSLVSDDGEYDDSVDGSSDESEVNDSIDAESVSDVAEIAFDDDHVGPRGLRHHPGSNGAGAETTVRLRKEENKHVTFVSPVKETDKQRRGRRVVS